MRSVLDPERRQPERVTDTRVEGHAVAGLREILTEPVDRLVAGVRPRGEPQQPVAVARHAVGERDRSIEPTGESEGTTGERGGDPAVKDAAAVEAGARPPGAVLVVVVDPDLGGGAAIAVDDVRVDAVAHESGVEREVAADEVVVVAQPTR